MENKALLGFNAVRAYLYYLPTAEQENSTAVYNELALRHTRDKGV